MTQIISEELSERGLVKQTTNPSKIKELLNQNSISFYVGFDPTADSLHVGHLVQLLTIKRLRNAGHFPIVLIGTATAQIGDPTGKNEVRKMLSGQEIQTNADKISKQIKNIVQLDDSSYFYPPSDGICARKNILNNSDWFGIKYLDFIKDIGAHFSVSNMLRAECFKSRMENGGLTFLEFNYMLMQAFDFYSLNRDLNCVMQIGGDDQWSNILAGVDLVRRKTQSEVFGLTLPLLLNSNGTKMGKTEKGTVWLDESKTSVFDFFQFWRNIPDVDVEKCFKLLSFLSVKDINNIPLASVGDYNDAKKKLALEITSLVHGQEKAIKAFNEAVEAFELGNISSLTPIELTNNSSILECIIKCQFAKSKTEARNLINNHGITLNNTLITDASMIISSSFLGNEIMIKKGKKNFARVLIKDV